MYWACRAEKFKINIRADIMVFIMNCEGGRFLNVRKYTYINCQIKLYNE
jgi:hypothetical protein